LLIITNQYLISPYCLCNIRVYHAERLSKEDNIKAKELLEQAIQIDPNLAPAWSTLANIHGLAARFGYSSSRGESPKLSKKFAEKAIEIDDSFSAPHTYLGDIYLMQRK
jgi:hypothetical protein